jgi:hypothetical protein
MFNVLMTSHLICMAWGTFRIGPVWTGSTYGEVCLMGMVLTEQNSICIAFSALKMEAAGSSKMYWYLSARIHGVMSQKFVILLFHPAKSHESHTELLRDENIVLYGVEQDKVQLYAVVNSVMNCQAV